MAEKKSQRPDPTTPEDERIRHERSMKLAEFNNDAAREAARGVFLMNGGAMAALLASDRIADVPACAGMAFSLGLCLAVGSMLLLHGARAWYPRKSRDGDENADQWADRIELSVSVVLLFGVGAFLFGAMATVSALA